jgi:uncharacterized protein DUF6636
MPFLVAAVIALTPGIRTPSGNISCFVSHQVLHCQLRHADYRPRCADLDWHGFELGARGRPQVTCSGGVLYDHKPTYRRLAYGRTWRFAAFMCVSRITGLTCTSGSGHGLFISRQSWRGW